MTKQELESNYKIIVNWTVERENAKTSKGMQEFTLGLRRVEEYEMELRSRGYTNDEIRMLYATCIFNEDFRLPVQH